MAAKGSPKSDEQRRSRVGSLLRTATGAVGAVGRVAGVTRGRGDEAATDSAAAKKASAKKAPAKKTPAKTAAKKAAAKKTPAKKTPAKKAAPTRSAAAKAPAQKAPASKTAVKKAAPAKKAAATTTPAKKSATAKKTTTSATAPAPKKETTVSTAAAPKSTAKKAPSRARKSAAQTAADLVVREDESPWTPEELTEVHGELSAEIERFRTELKSIEADIAGLIHDDNGGAGDDQADVGSKALEREYEYSLAQNNRASMEQAIRAMARIDDGTYGICESCGNPIGKLRLQAFPRATLCMQCKQKQERR
ncbi:TraR/DksA family transcriptional regulator [Calidifontibacter indicus]|uniref:TraR/DksA family transcriptional regulator n=1 Tax=Calidifontibacter indicus TaxID=419650 RepID=UPI003D73BC0F